MTDALHVSASGTDVRPYAALTQAALDSAPDDTEHHRVMASHLWFLITLCRRWEDK